MNQQPRGVDAHLHFRELTAQPGIRRAPCRTAGVPAYATTSSSARTPAPGHGRVPAALEIERLHELEPARRYDIVGRDRGVVEVDVRRRHAAKPHQSSGRPNVTPGGSSRRRRRRCRGRPRLGHGSTRRSRRRDRHPSTSASCRSARVGRRAVRRVVRSVSAELACGSTSTPRPDVASTHGGTTRCRGSRCNRSIARTDRRMTRRPERDGRRDAPELLEHEQRRGFEPEPAVLLGHVDAEKTHARVLCTSCAAARLLFLAFARDVRQARAHVAPRGPRSLVVRRSAGIRARAPGFSP